LLCSVVIFGILYFGNFVTKGTSIHNNQNENILRIFRGRYIVLPDKVIVEEAKIVKQEVVVEEPKGLIFMVSAYDLSVQSTGKSRGSSNYGKTSTGFSLKDKTRISAMTVAVDPKVIPINSKVKITFINDKYIMYNGIYRAFDQGGLIKGRKLDLFMGDFQSDSPNSKTVNFGVEKAYVKIIKED